MLCLRRSLEFCNFGEILEGSRLSVALQISITITILEVQRQNLSELNRVLGDGQCFHSVRHHLR